MLTLLAVIYFTIAARDGDFRHEYGWNQWWEARMAGLCGSFGGCGWGDDGDVCWREVVGEEEIGDAVGAGVWEGEVGLGWMTGRKGLVEVSYEDPLSSCAFMICLVIVRSGNFLWAKRKRLLHMVHHAHAMPCHAISSCKLVYATSAC